MVFIWGGFNGGILLFTVLSIIMHVASYLKTQALLSDRGGCSEEVTYHNPWMQSPDNSYTSLFIYQLIFISSLGFNSIYNQTVTPICGPVVLAEITIISPRCCLLLFLSNGLNPL